MKTFIVSWLHVYKHMIVVKISEKIEYNVEKLQREFQVSRNIPKVLITSSGRK